MIQNYMGQFEHVLGKQIELLTQDNQTRSHKNSS
jgi:hypothetical protein